MSRQGAVRERNLDNIKDFWSREAKEWGEDPRVTIRDHYFRLLELESIIEAVRGRRTVLDVGCGSGYSTLYLAEAVDEIVGADYVEGMIAWAKRFLDDPAYFAKVMGRFPTEPRPTLRGNIRFETADMLNLPYAPDSFDAITASRALINLPTQDLQARAISQIAKVLKPGGVWALAEVTKQGHAHMDRVRALFGLPILEKYWHNLYVDEAALPEILRGTGLAVRRVQRFETYQFLTKAVHPLVAAPSEPKFLDGFNRAARAAARRYPTCDAVKSFGLDKFFRDVFMPLLEAEDPTKVEACARVVPRVLDVRPDFSGCSHQVLFVLDRP